MPLLKGETPADWRDAIYYHYYEFPSVHMVAKHNGVRTERYKLMQFYEFGEWEFYDLAEDPDELTNQYNNAEYAEVIKAMKQKLTALVDQYQDNSDMKEMPADWKAKFRPGKS